MFFTCCDEVFSLGGVASFLRGRASVVPYER